MAWVQFNVTRRKRLLAARRRLVKYFNESLDLGLASACSRKAAQVKDMADLHKY